MTEVYRDKAVTTQGTDVSETELSPSALDTGRASLDVCLSYARESLDTSCSERYGPHEAHVSAGS